jgi:hypothetical protein
MKYDAMSFLLTWCDDNIDTCSRHSSREPVGNVLGFCIVVERNAICQIWPCMYVNESTFRRHNTRRANSTKCANSIGHGRHGKESMKNGMSFALAVPHTRLKMTPLSTIRGASTLE